MSDKIHAPMWKSLSFLHPHQLASLGVLRGLSPAKACEARILIVGLADLGELIPLAAYLPQATFVGLDVSGPASKAAKEHIESLELENVRLVEGLTGGLIEEGGPFDYIVARNVLDRADAPREELLRGCAKALAPQGLAVFTYHALPGWQPMADFSAWIGQFIDLDAPEAEQILNVRALASVLVGGGSDKRAEREGLRSLSMTVAAMDDRSVLEDILAPSFQPLRLFEMVTTAEKEGLAYLGDAQRDPGHVQLLEGLSRDLAEGGLTDLGLESLGELSLPRPYRASVFARAPLPDTIGGLPGFDSQRIALHLVPSQGESNLMAETESFRGPYGTNIEVESRLLRAAINRISAMYPNALLIEEAIEGARKTLADIDQSWAVLIDEPEIESTKGILAHLCFVGLAQLRSDPLPIALEIDATPRVHALVKYQAKHGDWVTTPTLLDAELGPLLRALVLTLDGERDEGKIAVELNRALERGDLGLEREGALPTDPLNRQLMLRGHLMQGLNQLRQIGLLATTSDEQSD